MKRSAAAILFAWWFLLVGNGGRFGPDIFMMVGPFQDSASCTEKAKWAENNGAKRVTDCWEGTKI